MSQQQHDSRQPQLPKFPTPPEHLVKNLPLPHHKHCVDQLQSMFNGILIETAKTLRAANRRQQHAQALNGVRPPLTFDTQRLEVFLPDAIPRFHGALDEMEKEIVRARAVVERDLRVVRDRAARGGMPITAGGMDREIEVASIRMANNVDPAAQAGGQGGSRSDDLDMMFGLNNGQIDERGTGSGSIEAGHNITEAMKAGQGQLHIPSQAHTLEGLRVNNNIMAGDMQQDIQFPNTAGSGQVPHRPQTVSPNTQQQHVMSPMAQARQAASMQQRSQSQPQPQGQSQHFQPQPHVLPRAQQLKMPEDDIAFSALPGSVPHSPQARPSHSGPSPPPTILPPASHHLVTQGGVTIPAQALPLLPPHMRQQMAEVHTHAVLTEKGIPVPQRVAEPQFWLSDSESVGGSVGGSEKGKEETPATVRSAMEADRKMQGGPTSQPRPNRLDSPFEPQMKQEVKQSQTPEPGQVPQHQDQQQQNETHGPRPAPPGHEVIDFDALFDADGQQDAAQTDINFDEFFNDMVATGAGTEGQGQGEGHAANMEGGGVGVGVGGGDGGGEFDLSTFGAFDGAGHNVAPAEGSGSGGAGLGNIGGGNAANGMLDLGGDAGNHMDLGDLGQGNGGSSAGGVGLGINMLEGLESYANQATDDDPMDGLDFGQMAHDSNASMNLGQPGGAQGDLNTGQGNSGHNSGSGSGDTNANTHAFGGDGNNDMDFGGNANQDQGFDMSHADLEAMNMSMDQGTSFDDLLDGMDFGGGGEGEGGNGGVGDGGELSEFDDAFFGR